NLQVAPSNGQIRSELTRVQRKEGIARIHGLPDLDEDLTGHPGERRADSDVLAVGFDQTYGCDSPGEVRDGRRRGGIGAMPAGSCSGHGVRRPQSGEDPESRQEETFHRAASLRNGSASMPPSREDSLAR